MDDHSPHHFDDEQDDGYDALSALDFSAPDGASSQDETGSELAGFDEYVDYVSESAEPAVVDTGLDALAVEEDAFPVPLFTVTNPPGTVTVTAYMDGRINLVELSPQAARMSESQLADEIVVIARLATQDARSAQYEFMLEGMRQQGHDDAATRDFLNRDLDLPSPEEAGRARASVFSTRYAGDHD